MGSMVSRSSQPTRSYTVDGRSLKCGSVPAFRGGSLGAGATFVGCPGVGLQAVEEVADRSLGAEYVTSRVLPVLRDDLAFPLRLRQALPPDPDGQAPFIAQPHPAGVAAPFGQLVRQSEPAQERAS